MRDRSNEFYCRHCGQRIWYPDRAALYVTLMRLGRSVQRWRWWDEKAESWVETDSADFGDAIADRCDGILAEREASPEPTPDSGLDVERMAEAIRNVYIAPSASREMDAENIVREYARLSSTDSPEEES